MREVVLGALLQGIGYPAQAHGSLSVELFSKPNFEGISFG